MFEKLNKYLLRSFWIISILFLGCVNRFKSNRDIAENVIHDSMLIKMKSSFRDFNEHKIIYDSLEIEIGAGFFNDSIELVVNNKLISKLSCSYDYTIGDCTCKEILSDSFRLISAKKLDKSSFRVNDTLRINYLDKIFYTILRKDYNILMIEKLDSIRWESIYFRGVDKSKHIKE